MESATCRHYTHPCPAEGGARGACIGDSLYRDQSVVVSPRNTSFPAATPYALSVYLAGSDGRYSTAPIASPLNEPARIFPRDLNADGHQDLLLLPSSRSQVWSWLGDSMGKFTVTPPVAVDRPARDVAFADMTGDGKPDLVVARSSGMSLLFANRTP